MKYELNRSYNGGGVVHVLKSELSRPAHQPLRTEGAGASEPRQLLFSFEIMDKFPRDFLRKKLYTDLYMSIILAQAIRARF